MQSREAGSIAQSSAALSGASRIPIPAEHRQASMMPAAARGNVKRFVLICP